VEIDWPASAGGIHKTRFFAARLYQNPERSKTTAQPPVKRIRNGEGSINQANTHPAADNPAHR
jgi:hypothetical protein